jgi:hypothetical protein
MIIESNNIFNLFNLNINFHVYRLTFFLNDNSSTFFLQSEGSESLCFSCEKRALHGKINTRILFQIGNENDLQPENKPRAMSCFIVRGSSTKKLHPKK